MLIDRWWRWCCYNRLLDITEFVFCHLFHPLYSLILRSARTAPVIPSHQTQHKSSSTEGLTQTGKTRKENKNIQKVNEKERDGGRSYREEVVCVCVGRGGQVTATQKQSGGKSRTLEPINSLHMF